MKLFFRILVYLDIFENKSKYNVICPFHNDTDASLLINLNTESFYCFGCNKGGGINDLIKLVWPNKNILQISKELKCSNNVNLEKIIINKKEKRDESYSLELSKNYYDTLYQQDWNDVDDNLLYLYKYMVRRGFNGDVLNKIKMKYTYNDSYPLIFPLYDNKVFNGYIRRTIDKKIEKKRKYLYNEGFRRANCLIGNYNNSTILVTEGFLDMVKARMFGFKFSTALLGWKASDVHIEKMKNAGVKNIISALDNDSPGINGTIYLKKFFNVKRFKFPNGIKDLGEINEKEFKESINRCNK